MLKSLPNPFGDPSPAQRVTASKAVLRSANAPLAERAAAILLLASESDSESKRLILEIGGDSHAHPWLQQTAGEAVAQMLETGVLAMADITRLTPTAGEMAVAVIAADSDSPTDGPVAHIKKLSELSTDQAQERKGR
jgi:hypothetical protein